MQEKNDERGDRLKKLLLINKEGLVPYADRFEKTHSIADVKNKKVGSHVRVAGRIMLFRKMGKLTFLHIQDYYGRIQIVLKSDELGEKQYDLFSKIVDAGDFIGVEGEVYITKTEELSVLAKSYTFLSKALRPLPDKWHGLKNVELKYRKRYLDLIMSEETRERFAFRSDFIRSLREYYFDNRFSEIETPILCNTPSGALAKPFKTHHNALGTDVYLRIAPEIFLKQAIIGGYERVFEIARSFRNEGIDPSHLQDFTMVEHYCAYWNFEDNMKFTEEMFSVIIRKLKKSLKIKIPNRNGEVIEVDFKAPWKRVDFRTLLINDCGIDINEHPTVESLKKEIKRKDIRIDKIEKLGRGNLIDALYKVVSREKLVDPVFLINHPIDISPLARKNDANPLVTDRFQLVVNGWEVVNAYSELIDPVEQKKRFEEQTKFRETGDEEAMMKDFEYVEAMEYGMPPISGWGMGIDRMVALLTSQSNLKDVVLFPLLKPEE
ncbi:MAG: lysine--tRNA ligase [Hyphomicrobium sp.]|uniref:lysine--tRNA ligase n=1 Tax=Hyphomicrobium sp. TaxID=82 RepID=UPI00356809A4